MFTQDLIELISRTTGLMISHRLADKVCRNKNGKDGQTRQCRYSYLQCWNFLSICYLPEAFLPFDRGRRRRVGSEKERRRGHRCEASPKNTKCAFHWLGIIVRLTFFMVCANTFSWQPFLYDMWRTRFFVAISLTHLYQLLCIKSHEVCHLSRCELSTCAWCQAQSFSFERLWKLLRRTLFHLYTAAIRAVRIWYPTW